MQIPVVEGCEQNGLYRVGDIAMHSDVLQPVIFVVRLLHACEIIVTNGVILTFERFNVSIEIEILIKLYAQVNTQSPTTFCP